MPRRNLLLVLSTASLVLAGCATSSIDMAPVRADRPWTPPVDAAGEIVPGAKPAPESTDEATYALPANSRAADLPAPLQIDHERAYSLAELIDIAESSNPVTRIAWNNAREVALAAGIARSAYLPRLTASVIGGRHDSHDHGSRESVRSTTDVTADGVISTLSLQWLLFDFGQRAAIVGAAEQASVISNLGFTAAHQQVIHDVSVTFYAYTAARARVDNAVRSLENAKDVQAAAEGRLAHGIGTVIEVAQARQATAQSRLLHVQAGGAAENAYLALIAAMGISPMNRINVADISGRELPPNVSGSLESVIADALARRPDVLSAYAAQRAGEENVRAARAEFLPKFFLSASGSYNTNNLNVTAIPSAGEPGPAIDLADHGFGNTILAGVTVPIFDGGIRAARLKQARAKADSAATELIRTQEEAVREIVLAANTLRTSLSAYDASSALASAARTTFDAALVAYRNGVGPITDVTLAESQLLQAKTASSDAYSAALSAAATFALAAGTLGSAPP